jgi:hypothetical protein
MIRRRALLAVQNLGANSNNWACELHFTPVWEGPPFDRYADVYGDFSEVFEILTRMTQTIGATDPAGNIYLDEIPEEVNITVDGKRLSSIVINRNGDFIDVDFGNGYCTGVLYSTGLSLNMWT